MKSRPLVSIITPSYNQDRFIRETIESVLSQDYDNIEYIIVDGGSTDNTLKILEEYGDRIKWISEKDSGQSNAINKGFKMAHGEIVAWLNSDDTYELGAVRKAVEAFEDDEMLALVYGDGYIIDENSRKVMKFAATQEFDLWTLVSIWDYIMQPTTFFKHEALINVGYLKEDLNWCMDWDLWIRLAINYKVKYIKEILANSREYGETKTSTGGFKRLKEIQGIMNKYCNKKKPLGYYLYAADTLVKVTQGMFIINYLSKCISHFTAKIIFKGLPTISSDGWVGKGLRLLVPNERSRLVMKISIINGKTLPLNIRVFQNGIQIKKFKIKLIGQEEIEIVVNKNFSKNNCVQEIYVKTNRSFVPGNGDHRRLSFICNSIDYLVVEETV